jgi:hypothetical protein
MAALFRTVEPRHRFASDDQRNPFTGYHVDEVVGRCGYCGAKMSCAFLSPGVRQFTRRPPGVFASKVIGCRTVRCAAILRNITDSGSCVWTRVSE